MTLDLDHLEQVLRAPKTLTFVPSAWTPSSHRNSTKLEMVVSLDIDGVTQEGLALRATAIAELPDRQLTIQLEHEPPGRKRTPLHRLDWKPLHTHNNKRLGPSHLRFVQQNGTHLHDFFENKSVGEAAFQPRGNLPIAFPVVPEPQSFQKLIEILPDRFMIVDADRLPEPPWTPRLGL